MTRNIYLTAGSISHRYGWCLWTIVLLLVSTIGWAQQERTRRDAPSDRTPRSLRVKVVQLPAPTTSSSVSFERALSLSASLEVPSAQKLTLEQIGQLAWAAQGARVPQAGSAGPGTTTLPPLKVYFSLPDGTYVYDPLNHALQQIAERDVRGVVAQAVFSQQPNATAPATTGGCQIIIAGSARDFTAGYGQKARSVMALLAGQMSQNLQLQAVTLDLTYVSSADVDSAAIERALRLPRGTSAVYVALVGHPASRAAEAGEQQQVYRQAVLVVPPSGYQDQELSETSRTLALASVQTVIASTRAGRLVGSFGSSAQADLPLNQVDIDDFDAVVYIGGLGTIEYYNNPLAVELARDAVARQKVVAASSTAPVILANAGVLKGVQATCLPSERNLLIAAGAIFTGAGVERDGRIITSAGPLVVPLFASTIVEALAGN